MSQLSELMDQVRPDLEPLATHYLAKEETIVKERYLVLLLASLLEGGALTEPQTRLLEMLLASIQGVQSLVFYLQQAAKLNKKELLISLEMFRKDKTLSNAFIFDLLVLLRVAGVPSERSKHQLSQLAELLKLTNSEVYKLIYCCILLLNGTVDMDNENCVKYIYAKDFESKELIAKFFFEDIKINNDLSLEEDKSNYFNFLGGVHSFEKEESDVFPSNQWTLIKDSPFKSGNLLPAGTFAIRAIKLGVYKIFYVPAGLVIDVYKTDWSLDSWKETDGAVAKMLIFPDGLNAWIPLFESKE